VAFPSKKWKVCFSLLFFWTHSTPSESGVFRETSPFLFWLRFFFSFAFPHSFLCFFYARTLRHVFLVFFSISGTNDTKKKFFFSFFKK
jgi:predicted membrane protein